MIISAKVRPYKSILLFIRFISELAGMMSLKFQKRKLKVFQNQIESSNHKEILLLIITLKDMKFYQNF